ncbi:osmoprotectant transport system permease protein [Silvimonas terrae]|uniref:Osmoprotectant transport system permease protein n=1 Tax=Silvimonas terrae TaxID=300266 RepID=A0A840RGI0_9NEIS|nr:ABC transporter permease [Silvimonas terrae]MBB5192709.1 osmoprotectant transport system permease protein [Silvimonas terrae]
MQAVHNRVLLLLWLLGAMAAWQWPLLTHAPNRLVTGVGMTLASCLTGWHVLILIPALLLGVASFVSPRPAREVVVLLACATWLAGLLAVGGDVARTLANTDSSYSRTSFGGGTWALWVLGWLAAADALGRLKLNPRDTVLVALAVLAPGVVLLFSGALAELSVLKEYANRQDVFDAALLRHLAIVAATLVPTLLIGVPLGVAAFRRAGLRGPLFSVLNIIQTIPSIALFGLLIAPLAALAAHVPLLGELGVSGIGVTPAVIALTLYSLLPMARSTTAGLEQVPAAVVEAARGMGLSRRQVFWQVEVPLALPVLLSGLRITTVQAIGLTTVAALIGAGGFGAIMFQGLLSSALDLVLLGAVPVIALAIAADAVFKLLVSLLGARGQ